MVNKDITKENKQSSTIWGGRFNSKPSAIMEEINKKASFEGIFANFLLSLASNKRISLFLGIYDEFIALLKDHNDVVEAEIVFANDNVDKDQVEQIKQVIQKEKNSSFSILL